MKKKIYPVMEPLSDLSLKLSNDSRQGSLETALRRAYERERKARKVAEEVIESKSRELYEAYKNLERLNFSLEIKVQERTRQLKDAMLRAEESVRAKQSFLANMSHEIRTPMNAVLGFANLLLKTNATEQQFKWLRAIKSSADNLLVIINDILDYSKIESGKLKLESIEFNLYDLVQNVVFVFAPKAQAKGIVLAQSFSQDVQHTLVSDPTRLDQILTNLMSNAIKFTDRGSVTLSCQLYGENEFQQIVEFRVTDTGVGIEEKNLGRIFDSFSQEDESVSRRFGGTGLGLAITKSLTDLFNGTIEVSSQKHRGTVFTVRIPLGKHDNARQYQKQMPMEAVNFKGMKVLVAEDNELNRFLMESILQELAVDFEFALNGKEAVDKILANHFDIVLMDIHMPEMDGVEATQLLRQVYKKSIPIAALTASVIKEDVESYLRAGVDEFIPKPLEEATLVRVLGKYWGRGPTG